MKVYAPTIGAFETWKKLIGKHLICQYNIIIDTFHVQVEENCCCNSITHINNLKVLFPEGGVGNLGGIYIKLGSIFPISEMIVVFLFICLCFFAAVFNFLDAY